MFLVVFCRTCQLIVFVWDQRPAGLLCCQYLTVIGHSAYFVYFLMQIVMTIFFGHCLSPYLSVNVPSLRQHAIVTVQRLLADDRRSLSHIEIWGRLLVKELRSHKATASSIHYVHRWMRVVGLWHCRSEWRRRRCGCGGGRASGCRCWCASLIDHFGNCAFKRGDHFPPLLSFKNLYCHTRHILMF